MAWFPLLMVTFINWFPFNGKGISFIESGWARNLSKQQLMSHLDLLESDFNLSTVAVFDTVVFVQSAFLASTRFLYNLLSLIARHKTTSNRHFVSCTDCRFQYDFPEVLLSNLDCWPSCYDPGTWLLKQCKQGTQNHSKKTAQTWRFLDKHKAYPMSTSQVSLSAPVCL